MSGRLKRLAAIFVLLVISLVAYKYSFQRSYYEKHKISIPLDRQVQEILKKNNDMKNAVEVIQDFYWNAWLSSKALKNGGWKNILVLCTDDFRKQVEEKKEVQDALSVGSVHQNVRRIYLDTKRSKIVSVQPGEKKKDNLVVLVDIWLGIDQERAGDYFLHQQAAFELKKVNKKWLVDGFLLFAGEEKPADVIPE
ncbi:MAG: hypothetical protein N2440_03860 [Actinobacteria bacterium]|nr:hypothetical protein [Actinomycetota bacterium]